MNLTQPGPEPSLIAPMSELSLEPSPSYMSEPSLVSTIAPMPVPPFITSIVSELAPEVEDEVERDDDDDDDENQGPIAEEYSFPWISDIQPSTEAQQSEQSLDAVLSTQEAEDLILPVTQPSEVIFTFFLNLD